LLADSHAGPETAAERADMLVRVRRIIDEELTERQRQALILLGVQDMPMEDAARRLKTNRNALYKLLHDARLRLKRRLSMEDISPNEVLPLFEQK
jgi:RNA polymerase sigma-70 factor (ECF subfamily)